MILALDIGNTRCKWAVNNAGEFVQGGAFFLDNADDLNALLISQLEEVGCSAASFADILVASVRGDQQNQGWAKEFKNISDAPVWFAKVDPLFNGFQVAYKTPSNLGVDRWLAMLAAKKQFDGALIVIDAGSAITVDYINEQGNHDGGLIVPGVSMMSRALFSETHAVKVGQLAISKDWYPGDDTFPCVSNGVSAVLKGFLKEVRQQSCAKVLLTGGDALLLSAMLSGDVATVEHLVLDGLLVASEYQKRMVS